MASEYEKVDMRQEEIRGKLEKAFGDEFANKYKKKAKDITMKYRRLTVTPEVRKEVIEIAKSKLTPECPLVSFYNNEAKFHIALVETPEQIKIRSLAWTKAVSMLWDNKWFSANFNKDMEEKIGDLVGTTPYILVGNMGTKDRTDGKGKWYNFDVMDVLTMDDLSGDSKPSMAYDDDVEDKDKEDEDLAKED